MATRTIDVTKARNPTFHATSPGIASRHACGHGGTNTTNSIDREQAHPGDDQLFHQRLCDGIAPRPRSATRVRIHASRSIRMMAPYAPPTTANMTMPIAVAIAHGHELAVRTLGHERLQVAGGHGGEQIAHGSGPARHPRSRRWSRWSCTISSTYSRRKLSGTGAADARRVLAAHAACPSCRARATARCAAASRGG